MDKQNYHNRSVLGANALYESEEFVLWPGVK